jgi:hypothetical protein
MKLQEQKAMSVSQTSLAWPDSITTLLEKVASIPTKLRKRVARMFAHIVSLPAQISWGLSKPRFIEKNIFYSRYQKALKEHESNLPTLDLMEANIVEELDRKGICVTSLESLGIPNTAEFFQAAKKVSQELREMASLPAYKGNYEVHATTAQLMKRKEVFYWGLNDRVLKIVESYLRLPVAYDGVYCVLSVADGREIGPRAWHRDREDRRMVKVCVYLNNVNENGGPFQCLQPEINSLVCNSIKHRYKSVFHNEMEEFFSASTSDKLVSCTGSAGTVIFVDTAHYYHRGLPPTKSNRCALFFSYFSRRPWHPFFCQRSPYSDKEINCLAKGLSPHQQACVHWKNDLPKAVKWIPKSRI